MLVDYLPYLSSGLKQRRGRLMARSARVPTDRHVAVDGDRSACTASCEVRSAWRWRPSDWLRTCIRSIHLRQLFDALSHHPAAQVTLRQSRTQSTVPSCTRGTTMPARSRGLSYLRRVDRGVGPQAPCNEYPDVARTQKLSTLQV